ncbi:hypothetical protein C1645_738158 [Glomus cerebriforme]|uniref:Uncharacterized protein n=1 Tax=Glomus cerebriforme TaxID=658196 RepID=A0A397SV22_9GLOM|nr:hypothetical protein C1645_738158 [Glomus cerebriforme]
MTSNKQAMTSEEIDDIINNIIDRNKRLEEENANLRRKLKSLEQKNDALEKEASKYQSALGIATNFDLSDDGQSQGIKLIKDILALHDTLEKYVTNLKPEIDVNINEAKKLLDKYGCKANISDEEPNKPLIKAVLQRHVLEEILNQANYYFKQISSKEHHLESDIAFFTSLLTILVEKLYNNCLGNDEITHLTSIRLRQQVYTVLGTRGFNDIKKSNNEYSKHNFIEIISKKINKMMNKYRNIKDGEKKKYVNGLAENLVKNVVRIFCFRLLIQEPPAQYRWFDNNDKINKIYMKGSWDEDEIEDMVVEVCSFPMIYEPSPDVPNGFKVYTPAKVFASHIIKQSLIKKGISTVGCIFKNLNSSNNDSTLTPHISEDEYDVSSSDSVTQENEVSNNTNIVNK